MAVLFAGTELEAFAPSGTPAVSTTATFFDANASRMAMDLVDTDTVQANFAASTSGWLHFSLYHDDTVHNEADNQIFRLIDSNTAQVVLQLDGDNGIWNLEYWDGSVFVELAAVTLNEDVLTKYDIEWNIDNASGVFRLYQDGVLLSEFTGDTLHTGFTTINRVELNSGTSFASFHAYFSEVIVADEDTRGWRLVTIAPTADGNDTAWTGTFADIDEIDINDGDLINSPTADQIENFVYGDIPAAFDGFEPAAVVVSARGQNGGAGPSNVQANVRSGGTNYFSADLAGISGSFGPLQAVFATDPDDGDWTSTAVNSAQFGVRSRT